MRITASDDAPWSQINGLIRHVEAMEHRYKIETLGDVVWGEGRGRKGYER